MGRRKEVRAGRMFERRTEGGLAMAIPLTKTCPECQDEMELVTTDDVGEILVYECPECGYQEEMRIENEESDDLRFPAPADFLDEDDGPEPERFEPDEEE